ncbi:MAG: hypothetical protein GC189_05030 [Alphaproteobacteria bacterium]|nr:hypothetical protein [Alphaproteobacteria bacterium]
MSRADVARTRVPRFLRQAGFAAIAAAGVALLILAAAAAFVAGAAAVIVLAGVLAWRTARRSAGGQQGPRMLDARRTANGWVIEPA